MSIAEIHHDISNYYTDKLRNFGPTPKGVDWNSAESQELRFNQLLQIVNKDSFTVLDFGCGFGSMFSFIQSLYQNFQYTGYDISPEMIAEAKRLNKEDNAEWTLQLNIKSKWDYVVASGIFNVKLENSEQLWLQYILDTLHEINKFASRGFSFNILTKYSDKEYMKEYLYYADPCYLLDYCKLNFSKHVAILHDYPLYEFTVLVRKDV